MKRDRQKRILEIIAEQEIRTQGELVEVLLAEGFAVTQATVSRDIRQMNLTKSPGNDGRMKFVAAQKRDYPGKDRDKYIRVLRDGFLSMTPAMNLLVIKTVPGMGMAGAAALDELRFSQVLGSLGGDDTIFCATSDPESVMELMSELDEILKRS